eukprot:SAG31_NODE_1574_length_7845_cov_6.400207_3_plen_1384_part_00
MTSTASHSLRRFVLAAVYMIAKGAITGGAGNVAQTQAERYLSNVTHTMLRNRNGTVVVRNVDTPKELEPPVGTADVGIELGDALFVVPGGSGRPAEALLEVGLGADRAGTNRLDVYVKCTGVECTTIQHSALAWNMTNGTNVTYTRTWTTTTCIPAYDDAANAVSAFLAPQNNPYYVTRTVQLQRPNFVVHSGEWHAVLGDFFILPEEQTGSEKLRLFISFGGPAATVGSCSMTGLTLTTITQTNVALLKPVIATESQAYAGGETPANAILTNAELLPNPGQMWYRFDTSLPPTFEIDLQWKHHICSAAVHFNKAGRVWDWSLFVQNDTDAEYHEVFRITDTEWTDWTEAAQGDLANPISTEPRWFDCVDIHKAKIVLHATKNIIYALTEIELFGYDTQVDGICKHGCRQGGHCFNVVDQCRCVKKWGWRGALCDQDVDECAIIPADNAMLDMVDGDASGSVTQAEFNSFVVNRLNISVGGLKCADCWDDLQCLLDDDDNNQIAAAEFQPFQVLGNHTYDATVLATELGVNGYNGGCGLGDALSSRFVKATCINTPGSWKCACNSGFSGDSSTASSNTCVDIDECRREDNGGCEQLCVNLPPGSYYCSCRNGYALSSGSRTQCSPVCGKPCLHGGECLQPDQCVGCDDGWTGKYCDEPMCSVKVIAEDGSEATGCYHNGFCNSAAGCTGCDGGWSGEDCGGVDGGVLVLIAGGVSAIPVLMATILIAIKRKWLPFQERGSLLLVLGCAGQTLFMAAAPAISNPSLFGIALKYCRELEVAAGACIEEENAMWGRLLPYGIGFGLWFVCVLVRCRNLIDIHLKGKVPLSPILQCPVLTGIFVVTAVLPDAVANVAGLIVMVLYTIILMLASMQLLPLRKQITDVFPHILCGLLAALIVVALQALRMAGLSYTNPSGGINVAVPLALIGVLNLHLVLAVLRLIWKLIRKDKDIISQYAEGDDEEDTAKSRWKKGLRSAKVGAIIKLNADADAEGGDDKPKRKGGLLGLLKKGGADTESDSTSESEGSESSDHVSSSESSSDTENSSVEEAAIIGGRGGRGRGRGRSRGRGRWSRASRARARQLNDRTVMNPNSPQKKIGDNKANHVRTAAMLFQAVSGNKPSVPGAIETSGSFDTFAPQGAVSEESSDTDSDDSELAALEQEVSRFEGLLKNKIAKVNKQTGETYVPRDAPFHSSEVGSGFNAQLGLDMQIKARVVEKEAQPLYDPAVEESQDTGSGYADLQRTAAELQRVEAAESSSAGSSSEGEDFDFSDREYVVDIKTGIDASAGTTANVWVDLVGDHGDTGEIFLRNSAIATPFLPGQRDTFTIEWPDLGTLRKLRVGHDGSGTNPAWLIAWIRVGNPNDNNALSFSVGQWIDETGTAIELK